MAHQKYGDARLFDEYDLDQSGFVDSQEFLEGSLEPEAALTATPVVCSSGRWC